MAPFDARHYVAHTWRCLRHVLILVPIADRYAVLLMAASHYCIVNPSKAALIDLLALKARALSEINTALAKPNRAVTDAMIGAVCMQILE